MLALMERLWPINRSITGAGLRETLQIIAEYLPGLRTIEVPSGQQVLDWQIPEEWEITDAFLKDPDGNIVADFKENNLSVLGYSTAIDARLSLEELLPHLHTLPEQPDVIPYVTSYYQKNWGFCIAESKKQGLKLGTYHACIKAKHFKGSLTYGELILPGTSEKEVLISTYCCHPSMANNELSGPCVAVGLASWLQGLSHRHYTYRFVFIPEMIGSAAYLEANSIHLKEHVIAGFNLTCVGDERTWSFLPSRLENTYADKVALYALQTYCGSYDRYGWKDRGSDESMYCAPGIDLPVVSVMRSKYGTYPEYHTSLDTIGGVVTAEGLNGSLDLHKHIVRILENDCYPKSLVLGEPQLGKRGLYPMISAKGSTAPVKNRLNLISYADGNHSLLDIAVKCDIPFEELISEVALLKENHILSSLPV
ncbi:putative aminopeptidase-like domain protein [Nitritalea halalkaliphila LW7]|uniref:Putative aminopeptidase-like domain protein n=2 Tax=Nitritalea TaxID=1187887 RepID=I5C617_9BACT|nr:putative aminopeptidase-like domain protein [Nitritalea halalkaliphila LW7]